MDLDLDPWLQLQPVLVFLGSLAIGLQPELQLPPSLC